MIDLIDVEKTYNTGAGPVFVDHPSGVPQKPGDEYILWDN